MTPRPLPNETFKAGDDGCGPVTVTVQTRGGRGGDPVYVGGFITGHTGHAGSMMSANQMRRLAAALLDAVDTIDESGLPSWQYLREQKQSR